MAVSATPLLLSTQEGAVLTLTLNRPDSLNSLTDSLLDDLQSALLDAQDDEAVRAVVLTGSGRGFCAGADLKHDLAQTTAADIRRHLHDHYIPVILTMRSMEKPIIAAVNGVAAGAGLSLALAADFRIAAGAATFVQAFVRIGLVPDAGSSYFLPRLIGLAKATEMMMLGDAVDADEALRLGLVNRVVPNGDALATAQQLAARLAEGPRATGLIKRVLAQAFENDLEAQLLVEEETQAAASDTADFAEGLAAFLEKRRARFQGR